MMIASITRFELPIIADYLFWYYRWRLVMTSSLERWVCESQKWEKTQTEYYGRTLHTNDTVTDVTASRFRIYYYRMNSCRKLDLFKRVALPFESMMCTCTYETGVITASVY